MISSPENNQPSFGRLFKKPSLSRFRPEIKLSEEKSIDSLSVDSSNSKSKKRSILGSILKPSSVTNKLQKRSIQNLDEFNLFESQNSLSTRTSFSTSTQREA